MYLSQKQKEKSSLGRPLNFLFLFNTRSLAKNFSLHRSCKPFDIAIVINRSGKKKQDMHPQVYFMFRNEIGCRM